MREIADGRVYSGIQAKMLGLVDSFGGLDEASATAGKLAGTSDTTVVRYVQQPTFTEYAAGTPRPAGAAGRADHGRRRARTWNPSLTTSTCREPDTDSVVHEAHRASCTTRTSAFQHAPASPPLVSMSALLGEACIDRTLSMHKVRH